MPEAQIATEFALVRDFAVIMAAAGVATALFRRLKQPPILGYLLAGVIVGPFTLPFIGLNAPVANTTGVRLLADLGLVLMLFGVGLEFGWQRIRTLGPRVVLIGTIEITFMIALGYEVGILLGWTSTEAIFLGAALSISSSAVVIKMLRDSGALLKPHGRLIVGILVVEDFAAVLLLSVLSGIATTGTANIGDVGSLLTKLGLFLVSALLLGGLFAPRIVNAVARFNSRETLLIVGLALCFGLALIAEELGLSAAAGAFLIGAVLGDTDQAKELTSTMAPIRDVFAAMFFVSIGMLTDVSLVREFIVPAVIVSVVFIGGKVFVDTVGTFIAGHDGRTALYTGTRVPQMGEFSLAMTKVGADRAAVGTFLYPVIAAAVAIITLLYPFIFSSSEAVARFLESKSPRLLRQYVNNLGEWLISLRTMFALRGEVAENVRKSCKTIIANLIIIVMLVALGTAALGFTSDLADITKLKDSVLGLIVSVGVVALCVPSAVFIWRSLQRMTDYAADAILWRGTELTGVWGKANLRSILRHSILAVIVILVAIVSLPFLSRLVLLGSFSTPVPVLLVVGLVALLWRAAFKIHHILVSAFSRTFLGETTSKSHGTSTFD